MAVRVRMRSARITGDGREALVARGRGCAAVGKDLAKRCGKILRVAGDPAVGRLRHQDAIAVVRQEAKTCSTKSARGAGSESAGIFNDTTLKVAGQRTATV